MGKKRYMIYDGNTMIGTYTSPEAGEIFGVSRYTVSKYAYSGCLLKRRYKVIAEDDVLKREKIIRESDIRIDWPEEWERAASVIREEIEVEKLIQKDWERTVKPLRRKKIEIWRQ